MNEVLEFIEELIAVYENKLVALKNKRDAIKPPVTTDGDPGHVTPPTGPKP